MSLNETLTNLLVLRSKNNIFKDRSTSTLYEGEGNSSC